MRPVTPQLWRSLRIAEKRRFLNEMQRFWDVHRFRMAPEVADRFDELRERGRLSVESAAIAGIEPAARGARVSLRASGQEAVETVEFDRVINCTGAGSNITREAPALIENLLADGTGRPDDLSIGLDVDPSGALLDSSGRPSRRIHVVGCLRKGVEWEAIGVTEIRDHAAVVSREALSAATATGIAA
jgi:uncharacterized NAD(P)/FAD-binding protein YdhS